MSTDPAPRAASPDALAETESSLGQALALIHRILPRLDDPARGTEVQAALQKAAGCIESARQLHRQVLGLGKTGTSGVVQTAVAPEIVAVISAAIAAVLERPYRLVSVQPATAPTPHLNVWALEGRTQIFQSHKIR